MGRMRDRVRRIPLLGTAALRTKARLARGAFPGTAVYWERRYAAGGTSGPGSTGFLAESKAEFLNDFVARHQVTSVLELGCGDGEQLALAEYPTYTGFDIAPSALHRCSARFSGDPTKRFFVYERSSFEQGHGDVRAELALSLDVVFHLIEEDLFEAHLTHLFDAATRYVIIYGRDRADLATTGHVRDRRFTDWIERQRPQWQLIERVPSVHPFAGDIHTGTASEFFVYGRDEAPAAARRLSSDGALRGPRR